jgi:hypothetical protein
MYRRDLLRLGGTAGLFAIGAGRMNARQDLVAAVDAVDHLLLGVADLDSGTTWIERITGIRPTFGGSHPGRGTRNSLISLGGRHYLEIIAPDPDQKGGQSDFDLRSLTEPRLINWAAGTTDIDALAQRVRGAGGQVMGPRDGARARPDGATLKWKTLGLQSSFAQNGVNPIPFFIQWASDTRHPSEDSPKGCRLQSLDIAHPDHAGVAALLKQVGIDGAVKQAERAVLRATIETPKGPVYLT